YVFLVHEFFAEKKFRVETKWLLALLALIAIFTVSNLRPLRHRAEDFRWRILAQTTAVSTNNPTAAKDGILFVEMQVQGFRFASSPHRVFGEALASQEVLSIAANKDSPFVYFELAGERSVIARLPVSHPDSSPEYVTEGEQPAISTGGKWLAF